MSPVRFVVDGMLGSLARKLRMFGFDTLYYNSIDDDKIMAIGKEEHRILLTCDKTLFQRAINAGIESVLLNGSEDIDDMAHVLQNIKISDIEFLPPESRCPVCNGMLDTCGKDSVNKSVPENVLNAHEQFYVCRECGKVYWEGSHMKKLQQFAFAVKERLSNAA